MIRFRKDDGSAYPDWEKKKIADICTICKGAPLSKADIAENGTPFILYGELYTTYGEVTSNIVRRTDKVVDKKYYSQKGDVVIPTSGETPEEISTATCVMTEGVILAGDLNIYRSNMLDGRYFSYLMNHHKKYDVARIAQGASIIHIQASEVGKIKVPVPCLEEQQKIADFLTSVDEVIAESEKEVANLEAQKKGAMQKIFSKEVRFKADDGSDYSEWEESVLEENFEIVIDNRGKTPPLSETGYPLIEIAAVGGYYIKYDKIEKWVSQEIYDSWFRKHLKRGDILFSTVGNTAQCSYYDEKEKCCVAQNIVGLRFNEKIDSRFMFYLLVEEKNNRYIKSIQMNAVQPSIKVTQFIKLVFSVPCLEEQKKIADFLSDFDTAIEEAKKELECWKQIKKGLLQQMFV